MKQCSALIEDALSILRELVEAQDALDVEQRDIWSADRTQRLNGARTRASKAEAAARAALASEQGEQA